MQKHKTKRRIISILCASIIALYALAVPITAIVNSPEVGLGETGLYGQSTFPFTVGFVQRDESNGVNYIFATDVGGYGQNNNTTTDGDDIFHWVSTDESSNGSGSIGYEPTEVIWLDQIYYPTYSSGAYRGGFGGVDLSYNDLNNDPNMLPESIIFKADNIYYNPMWTTEVDPNNANAVIFRDSPEAGYEYMMPTIYLPQIDTTTQKFVGAYSVECSIIDMEGERHHISYSVPIDTSTYNDSIPFLRMDVLTPFINPNEITYGLTEQSQTNGTDATILIEQYRGYLDVDYYEYVEPIDDSLVGTWVFNQELTIPSFSPLVNGLYDVSTDFSYTTSDNTQRRYDVLRFQYSNVGFMQMAYVNTSNSDENRGVYNVADGVGRWSWNGYANVVTFYDEIDDVSVVEWIKANATKQGSTATVAEEGTWEKVTDRDLLNRVLVTYPMYNTSNVTAQLPFFETYLSYPDGEKMLKNLIELNEPSTVVIPEIDEEMYQDYTGWLGTAVGGFFNAPLIGGISLGVIVGVLVMIGCAIALLKLFAGG